MIQLSADHAGMDAVQRNVVLLFATFVSRQDGVSNEAQSERMRMPGGAKTSHKLDSEQQHCHAAAKRTRRDTRTGMKRSIPHVFALHIRTVESVQRFPGLTSLRLDG